MTNQTLNGVFARDFADAAHSSIGQVRKYTGEPYINHPVAVAEIVRSVPHTSAMIEAAYLHDVVEDTPISSNVIERVFGFAVASLVEMLTDVSRISDGNRKTRKEIDRMHMAKASPDAKTIKLADLIDNTRSIVVHDPIFAKVYIAEKALLLEVLQEGDATLWGIADEMVKKFQTRGRHEDRASGTRRPGYFSGPSCVRDATHWSPVPDAPEKSQQPRRAAGIQGNLFD